MICKDSGYFYAGLQFQSQCICVEQPPRESSERGETECDYNCPGDYDSACGGFFLMNFYKIDTNT